MVLGFTQGRLSTHLVIGKQQKVKEHDKMKQLQVSIKCHLANLPLLAASSPDILYSLWCGKRIKLQLSSC